MNNKYKNFIPAAILLAFLLSAAAAYSQPIGNPAFLPERSWSIGFSGDQSEFDIEGNNYVSTRGLFKFNFSVNKTFKVSLIAGTANMRIYYPRSKYLSRLTSKNSLTLGGSGKFVFDIPKIKKISLFSEFGGMHFNPIGHTYSTLDDNQTDYYYHYDWREFWSTTGTIVKLYPYDIYVAYQGRAIRQFEIFSRNEYYTGIFNCVIFGLDFHLPDNYLLNLQVRALNGSAITVGISQIALFK
ncbi:hypothetical protein ACFL7D_07720 [candidate division KSB1 bacterium]